MKRPIILVIAILIITIVYAIFWFKSRWVTLDEECYELYEIEKDNFYHGYVIKKFNDKRNHGAKTILLIDEQDTLSIGMAFDNSGLFEYIETNDIIVKNSGYYQVHLFRNHEQDTAFLIDYGCSK